MSLRTLSGWIQYVFGEAHFFQGLNKFQMQIHTKSTKFLKTAKIARAVVKTMVTA